MMGLQAEIRLRRGAFQLEVSLEVPPAETLAIVGPNGCGKTSCLMAIAGLLPIDGGEIRIAGQVLDDGSSAAFVPPEGREIGVVFQQGLLFPHLTVLQNVAYGPRSRGARKADALTAAAEWLGRMEISPELQHVRPDALSGGQAQRVALARALAGEPSVLLLDEPLAAVDASARLHLRKELRAHLETFAGPRILVAHDIADALALADRILVLEGGAVVQSGPVDALVRSPRSSYVADLVGLNRFSGRCQDGVVQLANTQLMVASDVSGEVLVTVHPRAVSLFLERPSGSPRNVWSVAVVRLESLPDRVRVQLDGELEIVAEITPAAVSDLGLREGTALFAAVKATELSVYPTG